MSYFGALMLSILIYLEACIVSQTAFVERSTYKLSLTLELSVVLNNLYGLYETVSVSSPWWNREGSDTDTVSYNIESLKYPQSYSRH
jgi:hypothetical protein